MADEVVKAPAKLPDSIKLDADYSWFTPVKGGTAYFTQRHKGEVIIDPVEIAYLMGINAALAE